MLLGFKTKLKVNNQQKTLLAQHAGYARFVYNFGLGLIKEAWQEKFYPTVNDLKKYFTNVIKKELPWTKNLSSRVYQYAFIDLNNALTRFKSKVSKFPRFKKKHGGDSFTLDNCGKPIKLNGTKAKLPFIGYVKTFERLPNCQVKKVTISKEADGWYLSFAYSQERAITPKSYPKVGVDLGIKELATLSTGEVIKTNQKLKLIKQRIQRLQWLGRNKVIKSNNWKRLQVKIAKLYLHASNIRRDLIHKLTTYLARNFEVIVIEDLNVKGLMANHKWAGSLSDQSFYEVRRQLEYKSQIQGNTLIIADRFYPSSQLCSSCGFKKENLTLKDRVYCCEKCNVTQDRDLNAAINLEKLGRLDLVKTSRQVRADSPG